MSLIFDKTDRRDDIYSQLTDHVNRGIGDGTVAIRNEIPAIIHWEGYEQRKLHILYHPGKAADLITTALNVDVFDGHKAHVVFDNDGGIMHIFITDQDIIELPAVYNMPVEGSA